MIFRHAEMSGHRDSGPNAVLGNGTRIGGQRRVTGGLGPGANLSGMAAIPRARVLGEGAGRAGVPELSCTFRRQEKEMDELRDRIARLELRESR